MTGGRVQLRDADERDLETFLEIEQACHVAPWSRGMYEAELARAGGVRLAAVVGDDQLVGGLFGAQLGDWHLMNVLVEPRMQGRGIGGLLVDAFLGHIEPHPVTLEVRVSNESAIRLYEARGFRRSGLRRRYYAGTEDAVVMWRAPGGAWRGDWSPPG